MKTSTTICTTILIEDSDETELINWRKIVNNLYSKDKLTDIARKVHCDERALSNLKQGVTREPKFSIGVQLLALHGLKFPNFHKQMGL